MEESRIIKKADFESVRHSAGQVADEIMHKWETHGKAQALKFARDKGWKGDFFVTSLVKQYRMTPQQYMKLTKTNILPPPGKKLTAMIPKDIITMENIYPLEGSVKRKLNATTGEEEVLYIVPRYGRGESFAPGQPMENALVYKGYLAYKEFLKSCPDANKDLTEDINRVKLACRVLKEKSGR